MELNKFKENFDKVLKKQVQENLEIFRKLLLPKKIHKITGYINEFMLKQWKRIRPYMLYIGYKLCWWKEDKEIIKFWTWLEIWHNFALIHDDIIDESIKRRWIKTYHKFVESLIYWKNAAHIWISQALLIWDLLFARASQIVFWHYKNFKPDNLKKAQSLFLEMTQQTIYWQIMDTELTTLPSVSSAIIAQKNYLKTSNYTFIKPLLIWAHLANWNSKNLKTLEKMWEHLGQAFQIRDDLKDISIDEEKSEKSCFLDIQEWQQTFLTAYVNNQDEEKYKKVLQKYLGKKLTKKEKLELRKMFEKSWAVEYAKKLLYKNLDEAKQHLDNIKCQHWEIKKHIMDIIKFLKQI